MTLHERGGYENCQLCWWEDDGQDDPHADEVWGGPNGDLSLTEARHNVRDHLTMYHRGADTRIGAEDSPAEVHAKRVIMHGCDRLQGQPPAAEAERLWVEIEAHEAVLEGEVHRKIAEYERQAGDERSVSRDAAADSRW